MLKIGENVERERERERERGEREGQGAVLVGRREMLVGHLLIICLLHNFKKYTEIT